MSPVERILSAERDAFVREKMIEFSRSELVITDRLHAMLFSAVTGTPCILLDSKSTKIRGCYEWVKDLGFIRLCERVDEICKLWEELRTETPRFDPARLKPYYEKLTDLIKSG